MAALSTSSLTPFHTFSGPTATVAPHIDLLKRAEACGNLLGKYQNAAAPTCAGSFSICTFSNGYQGCCDGSDNCQFYTSCNGGLVAASSRCTDSACLQCPSAVPYCTRYEFDEGVTAYEGFACGSYFVGDLIVYGTVGSQTVQALTTDLDSSSPTTSSTLSPSTTSATSSHPTTLSSSTSTSSIKASSASNAGSSASPTASQQPTSETAHKSHTAAIVGGVIGGCAAIALIFLCIYFYRRWRRDREEERNAPAMLEQSRPWR